MSSTSDGLHQVDHRWLTLGSTTEPLTREPLVGGLGGGPNDAV